jgi:predicted phosphodiesterase
MIYFLGDVHGNFDHILPALLADQTGDGQPKTAIFLGDLQAQRPFEEEIKPLIDAGIAVWFIHGNHDTDSRKDWDNLLPSWHRNLHGRVVVIDGLRVAGLGGVFRGKVWHPPEAARHLSFASLEQSEQYQPHTKAERNTRALKHSSTIFPDVYHHLTRQRADILVTHEAPTCHPHGFEAIDTLAKNMGVQAAFHGHHHDALNYRAWDTRLGFRAYGVGFCGIIDMHGGWVLAGDFDEARQYRQQYAKDDDMRTPK